MIDFTFGLSFNSNQTESSESLLVYGNNNALVTLDFRGVGLPGLAYEKFTNLINVITQGQADCLTQVGGMCILPNPCENYRQVFEEYKFSVWANSADYAKMVFPLWSLVKDRNHHGFEYCEVYVEEI